MRRLQHGFTIIELVVVMAIIAILGAIALPKFGDLTGEAQRTNYRSSAQAFESAVQLVRSQWFASGAPVTGAGFTMFVFDTVTAGTLEITTMGFPAFDTAGTMGHDMGGDIWNILLDTNWTAAAAAGWSSANGATADAVTFTHAGSGSTFTYTSLVGTVAQ